MTDTTILILFPGAFNIDYVNQQIPNEVYIVLHPAFMTRHVYHPKAVRHRTDTAKALAAEVKGLSNRRLVIPDVVAVITPDKYPDFFAKMMKRTSPIDMEASPIDREASPTIITPFIPDDDILDDCKRMRAKIIPSHAFALNAMNFDRYYEGRLPTLKRTMYLSIGFNKAAGVDIDFGASTDTENRERLIDEDDRHGDAIVYPTTTKDALASLDDFLSTRLVYFGRFEDAISPTQPLINHSNISASLNIGLLTTFDISTRIDVLKRIFVDGNKAMMKSMKGVPYVAAISKAIKGAKDAKDMLRYLRNSLEAFTRQIFGWREYMQAIWWYGPQTLGKKETKVPKGIVRSPHGSWDHLMAGQLDHLFIRKVKKVGTTSIADLIAAGGILAAEVKKMQTSGYAHHIIRLMVIGNYLYLSGAHPADAVSIFMSSTVDAYPWVMYGNVIYMSMFAFGNVYTRKPYFSSGNYIRKMSSGDYHTDKEMTEAFDDAYARYIAKK